MTGPLLSIDINADLGEGFPNDGRLLGLVTSTSVSCGAHAGDDETILSTLVSARLRGVAVGAHPGYAEREGFGRREQSMTADEVERLILGQVASLSRLARICKVDPRFVKPHGALYNQAQRDVEIARGVVAAMRVLGLPVLGQTGSALERLAAEGGVRFIGEGFPDRRYQPDGRLVPRTSPDAILHEPAEIEAQVVRFVREGVATLCIHGDDPRAVENAENVRSVLARNGISPRFWGS
jgi:5-oxoprolinase (ATP-hydrolysing) subunit A